MTERLFEIETERSLKAARDFLVESKRVPRKCPKLNCIEIMNVRFLNIHKGTILTLESNPPRLPTKQKHLLYEIHPVCHGGCIFEGNSNIAVALSQSNKGKVEVSIKSRSDV